MIDFIFSDKTGTLTQNELEFKYLSVTKKGSVEETGDGSVVIGAEDLTEKLTDLKESHSTEMFFNCLNICHGCVSIPDKKTGDSTYSGSSMDELCLLEMAKK
jgi:phospholipid-transporting ATPase